MTKSWSEADVPDQSGRIALVTGANSGIGFEAARVLAARGARVLLACRDADRARAARLRILDLHPDADVVHLPLDLADRLSIANAAARVTDEPRLDLLINNAGVMAPPRSETRDGFELQFGVNHLGHFALTGRLLEVVLATPGSRIVHVSSNGHRIGRIDFDDLQAVKSYGRSRQYAMSKLANLLFCYELQRRLEARGADSISVACHPGAAGTELGRDLPWLLDRLAPLMRRMVQAPALGALPTLRAATDPGVRGGEYYGPAHRFETGGPPVRVRSHPRSHDTEVAERLWARSIELTGVDPKI